MAESLTGCFDFGDGFWVELVLCGLDPGVEGFGCVGFEDGYGGLGDNFSSVHSRIDPMHGATGGGNLGVPCLFPRLQARKGGKEGGVDVHDTAWEAV